MLKWPKTKNLTEQKFANKLSGRHFPKKIDQEYKWEICAVYNSHIQITIVLDWKCRNLLLCLHKCWQSGCLQLLCQHSNYSHLHQVRHEREGALGVASYYYLQASRLLVQAVELHGACQPELLDRAEQYKERGDLLVAREAGGARAASVAPGTSELGRAHRLVMFIELCLIRALSVWLKKLLNLTSVGKALRR